MAKAKKKNEFPRIADGYVSNFNTLKAAIASGSEREGNVCLVQTRRKSDGVFVPLVCAVNRGADGTIELVPVAQMIDGNPYEMYDPVTAEEPARKSAAAGAGALAEEDDDVKAE